MSHRKSTRLDYFLPSLKVSLMMVIILIAGSIIFGLILGLAQTLIPGGPWKSQWTAYLMTMFLPLLFVWIAAGHSKVDAIMDDRNYVLINRPNFGRLGGWATFAILAVAMPALMVVTEPTTSFIPMNDYFKDLFRKAFMETTLPDTIVTTCIMAPLFEELFCRGLMLRGMELTLGYKKAIIWSSLFFAVMHMNPWQAIPAFIIGLFFGWVYWKTHCLWATIFMHCINNSLSTLLSRTVPGMDIDDGLVDILSFWTYIVVFTASAVLIFVVIKLLNKYIPSRKYDNEQETIPA